MKDRVLLSVTQILDDETGIYSGDLCDFSIRSGDLEDFLKSHGEKGAKEICDNLDYLKKAVMEEYLPKSKETKGKNKMKIKLSKVQWEGIGKKAGWIKTAVKFLVVDNEFNRSNYPDLVGKSFDKPPSYAQVIEVSPDEKKERIMDMKKDLGK